MATVKKVRCSEAAFSFITQGKEYSVLAEDETTYLLTDDDGDEISFRKVFFEPVEEVMDPVEIFRKATEVPVSAKDTQVGGNHYSKLAIQPYEYTLANGLGGLEHTIIKYVTRWKDKNGVEDLKKARHTLDFLIEYTEKQNG